MRKIVLCVTLVSLLSTIGWAQVSAASRRVIDGKQNPELVPDTVAWLMLFKSVADGPRAPSYRSRAALVASSGLSEYQIRQLISAANDATQQIHQMEEEVFATAMADDAKTRALRARRDGIVTATANQLLARLDVGGAEKLRQHVDKKVKTRIVITE